MVEPSTSSDAQFFHDNAGWSYDPTTETPEEGRARTAERLAAAEQRLKSGPYFIRVVPDDEPWDGDVPWDGPIWTVGLYSVEDNAAPQLIGSLSSVACEEGDAYLRVVAAELANEHLMS